MIYGNLWIAKEGVKYFLKTSFLIVSYYIILKVFRELSTAIFKNIVNFLYDFEKNVLYFIIAKKFAILMKR